MSEPKVTNVIYKSGVHPTQHWDQMQVIIQDEPSKHTLQHFLIARDGNGTILRRTDVLLDRWEIITDEEDLRVFRSHFDNRDRLALQEKANAAGGPS